MKPPSNSGSRRGWRSRSVGAACGLGLLWTTAVLPAAAALEPEGWTAFDSVSFRMIGNGDPEISAGVLADLERFRRAFEQLAPGIDASFPIPTQIIAFRDAEAYAPFKTTADTESTKILGQFLSHQDGNYITLNVDPRWSGGLGIVIHEYVHHIINQNLPRVPRWLNEGLAEYYSSFSVEGEFAVIGRPVMRHMNWWRRNRELSLVSVLSESHGAPVHSRGSAGQFYAVSWGLAHYLMSSPQGPGVLASYLEAVALGEDRADALFSALGFSIRELADELRSHVGAGSLPTASLALDELGAIEISRAAAPASQTLTALGELAARLGDRRHAEELFDLALAYDGGNSEALAGLAGLRDAEARLEEAGVLFSQALAAGPRAARTFLRHGRHLLRRVEAARAEAPETRRPLVVEAKTSFLAALALDPSFAEVYSMLGLVHLYEGLEAGDGLEFARRARELLPTRPDVVHTLIRLHLKKGEIAHADELLRGGFRLLADREAQVLVEEEIRRAEFLLGAKEALAKGSWEEGLALYDQAIAHTSDAGVRLQMERQLESLERRAEVERKAAGGGRR